jgi:tetratricopeptide (TPR) repeat protein
MRFDEDRRAETRRSMKRRIIPQFPMCLLLLLLFAPLPLAGEGPGVRAHACHDAALPDPGAFPPPPRMDGIGQAHLQVSCSPEAQRYFDQGLNLIHCFWDFEALRAFREAVRLDPSCAMGWWGIHRSLFYNRREQGSEREAALAKAVELSEKASEHERRYIRAASELMVKDRPPAEARAAFIREMEALIDLHPEDLQAKLLLADFLRQGYEPADGRPRDGQLYSQALLRSLLAEHPDNAAAHHYWIHAVENSSRPGEGLASAAVLTKLAPRCGHIVHMPGHIFYRIGDYEKARASFLESREVDLAYQREQGIAPVNNWNYVHNLDYLVGSCAEDGRYQEGLRWADELASLSVDPARSNSLGLGFILYGGQTARARLQMRYGFWDDAARSLETVVAMAVPSEESLARDYHGGMLAYAQGMAAFTRGDAAALKAKITDLDNRMQKLSGATPKVGSDSYFSTAAKILTVNLLELRGALASLEGRHDEAVATLRDAVDRERDLGYWEPPHYTRPVVETLAGIAEKAGRWKEAREAWQHSLQLRPGNGHALHGLARTWAAEGNRDEAAKAYEAFRQAWKDADRELLRPAP